MSIDFSRFEVVDDAGVRLLSAGCDIVFYFDCSYEQAAAGISYALDQFLARCPKPRWYRTDSMDEHKPVTERTVTMLRGWLNPGAKTREYIGIELCDAESFESTSDHSFSVHAMSKKSEDFDDFSSSLRLAFAPTFLASDAAQFRQMVVEVAQRIPFVSAHAGYCLTPTEYGETESVALAYPVLMRHPGLDLVATSSAAYDVKGGFIKGVNWLTLISRAMAGKLGGPKAVIHAGEAAGVAVTPVGAGYMLQAGSQPVIGDVNRRIGAPEYAAVMRMLEPLMAPTYSCLPIVSDDAAEMTDKWFRRFLLQ